MPLSVLAHRVFGFQRQHPRVSVIKRPLPSRDGFEVFGHETLAFGTVHDGGIIPLRLAGGNPSEAVEASGQPQTGGVLVFQGLTNKEIAARLDISEGAVKTSLRLLFDKLRVRTRAQLVKIALEQYRDQL